MCFVEAARRSDEPRWPGGAEGHPLRRPPAGSGWREVVGVDQLGGVDELPGRRRLPCPRIDPRGVLDGHGLGQILSAQVRKSGFLPGLGRWTCWGAAFPWWSCACCGFGALFWPLNVADVLLSLIGLPPVRHNRTHRSAALKRKSAPFQLLRFDRPNIPAIPPRHIAGAGWSSTGKFLALVKKELRPWPFPCVIAGSWLTWWCSLPTRRPLGPSGSLQPDGPSHL